MRLVHLKTGHFDDKIFIALKEALALIEVPIDHCIQLVSGMEACPLTLRGILLELWEIESYDTKTFLCSGF